ncbi:M64 family metallopeptidase [Roseateles sp. LYH14W]|uniref:M64 family metallopeptidase n=1 Tax=Pelomonas parva TaxID=3299032 RepID=A0ABW7F9P9_9BURK
MQPNSIPWLRALMRACAACLFAALAACGGGGGGTSAETVTPVATPAAPAASAAQPPTSAASAATASLKVDWPPIPYDVTAGWPFDIGLYVVGGDGKETWTVKCSAHITCAITGGSRLVVTSLAEDQPVETTIALSATNSQGHKGSLTVPMIAWPKSLKLTSLLGARDSPGIHLLILNDGFLPADMGLYRDAATGVLNELFSRPEIAAHRDAWNVHVAELVVLDDATGQAKASPLGARLGCSGVARAICFEDGLVKRAALAHLPHYSSIVLILNSTAFGGSGGSGVAAVTRQPKSAEVAVHELGHAFAGLADEYTQAPDTTPFRQFNSPNLTLKTDRNEIPWRHWIAADTPLPSPVNALTMQPDVVGLFEGGGYVSNGIYRPTFDSFMRSDTKLLGPVNAEAWALSVYAKGGAWRRIAPAVGATLTRNAQPAEGWLFEAQPLLGRSIAETRWYVDGVERTDQRGAGQLQVSTPGALQVRVDLVDLTGRVRLDQGVVNSLTWTVP